MFNYCFVRKKYNAGVFLNADLIEKELDTKGFIDLNDYGLQLTQEDLSKFLLTDRAKSFLKKAEQSNVEINFSIKENVIVDKEKEVHSYEGDIISAFLRSKLQSQKADFCFETVMSQSCIVKLISFLMPLLHAFFIQV